MFCSYENLFSRLQVFLIWIMYQMKALSFLYQMAQVTLVCGPAQLFLVEVRFLNSQQIIYYYNFKKWNKHILVKLTTRYYNYISNTN